MYLFKYITQNLSETHLLVRAHTDARALRSHTALSISRDSRVLFVDIKRVLYSKR